MQDNFIISKTCLLCSKPFRWNESIIIKAPEGACFCLSCTKKFEDTNPVDTYNIWISMEYHGQEELQYEST